MAHPSYLRSSSAWARTRRARRTSACLVDGNHPDIGGSLLLFGDELRKFRSKRNLSQKQLAELAGLDRNYVGLVERGECNISLIALVALARALSVKPAKLMASIR
jgi:DNA-binding XRE family transcriptional regulator